MHIVAYIRTFMHLCVAQRTYVRRSILAGYHHMFVRCVRVKKPQKKKNHACGKIQQGKSSLNKNKVHS